MQKLFFNNYLLMLPILSWIAAQVLKTLVDLFVNRKFSGERLVGSGGMPSSHSALVCSLLVGAIKKFGVSSPYVGIAFVLAMIVMYDAMGVRLETGRQAKLLNRLLEDLKQGGQMFDDEGKKLKELVGHTPFQVISGAILGILIALIIPVF